MRAYPFLIVASVVQNLTAAYLTGLFYLLQLLKFVK